MEPECFITSFKSAFFLNDSLHDAFLRWEIVRTSPNPQDRGPPLVGCQRRLMKRIRSYWSIRTHSSDLYSTRWSAVLEANTRWPHSANMGGGGGERNVYCVLEQGHLGDQEHGRMISWRIWGKRPWRRCMELAYFMARDRVRNKRCLSFMFCCNGVPYTQWAVYIFQWV
jgi:hypothetical protein